MPCKEMPSMSIRMKGASRGGTPWLLTAVLAVLLAACGQGAGTSNATSSPSTDPRDAALLYAQCMRTNGVPDFPDPDANGRFSLSHGEGGVDQDDPTFRAAAEKCRALAPGG
ncbi:MAG TPA: hypothetical protein VEK09_07515, partial [Jatrophihabitantaceae bacterium]|nr:hypothetical protein [Jatrophihabitantaceae bacterium]